MTETAYMTLTNSNSSLSKRFRVIAEGYDDGTPSKNMTTQKTVGGGLDVSQGAIYLSWSPTIRVRHTEEDSNYGTLAELLTFYSYNNPNGTPSDKITFIDHHGTSYTVVLVGNLQKSIMGCKIEGIYAWYLIKVTLQQVPT